MSRTNGATPPDPLDELGEAIGELEGENWEEVTGQFETTETHVHAAPGSTVLVDSGNPRTRQPTLPDNDKPTSDAPSKRGGVQGFALAVLDRIQPPWLRGVIVLAIVGAVTWRGMAWAGWVK